MQITKEKVVGIFEALDFKTASKWTPKKMQQQIKKLPELTDDETNLDDDELNSLLDDLLAAVDSEEAVEIEAPETKKAGGGKVVKKSSKKKTTTAKKTGPKKAGGNGKPGVIGSILEFLQAASAKKPLTKEQIVAKLANRFKDRDPESMAKTVNVQVPSRISAEKGVNVEKNENGYYISK